MSGLPTCIAPISAGMKCDEPSYREATLPLCFNHAFQVYMGVHQQVGMNLKAIFNTIKEREAGPTPQELAKAKAYEEQTQVYYMRIGGHIKIGFTQNIRERVSGLRLDISDVLATEPGGRKLEAQRHKEFNHLRLGTRENFKMTPELISHIAKVRRENGPPKITNYLTEVTV